MYFPRSVFRLILGLTGLALAATSAQAAPVLQVGIDKTRVYRLPEPAGGVAVGNTDIVTVALHDVRTILLTGKQVGDTELVVFDRSGAILRQLDLAVLRQNKNELTIVRGDEEKRFNCSGKCEPMP